MLWAAEIEAESVGPQARALVDISSLLVSDQHGIAERLKDARQGAYNVDAKLSAVLVEKTRAYAENLEFDALLTLQGAGEGEWVNQVAPEPRNLSFRQHLSFVRLPKPGYVVRKYHPGSGGFSLGRYDFSVPLGESLEERLQLRFRLEKAEPARLLSPAKRPIVFYLDPGIPEPVRSAVYEGANWWKSAFEKAGFKNGFRVEWMPPGFDSADSRYNVIQWIHRATRGWSQGVPIFDPRTGEIVRGVVSFDSQRVRQDMLIAESLLAPHGASANVAERRQIVEKMALARIRQLAAHEVGHALGFQHNFAASRAGNSSVMDYPHPLLKLTPDGQIQLQDAYGVGVGIWDDFLVAHAYSSFSPSEEAAQLQQLRQKIASAGASYQNDDDARGPASAHPDALLWDFGDNSAASFELVMKARRAALNGFSAGVLGATRQAGEIEARLVPVYLLHRYQTEALARKIGGESYSYGLASDARFGTSSVDAAAQRNALKLLLRTLSAEELALPKHVLDLLTPPAAGYERTREYFKTQSGAIFDVFSAVEAGAALSAQFLFEPARLNRLAWQHARDERTPGIGELLSSCFQATWQRGPVPKTIIAGEAVQLSANWVILDALVAALDSDKLHAAVAAEVRQSLATLQTWLAAHPGPPALAASRNAANRYIAQYLDDPTRVKRRPLPNIPPGGPI